MYLWSAMRAPAHDLDAQPLLVDLERGSEPDIQSDCHDETSCETGYETVYAEKGYAEQAYAGYPLAEKATAHSSGSPPPRVSKRVRAYCILSFLAIAVTWCKPFYFPNVRQGITKPAHQESDICLTPACVHAASELLYNLSPQYKELDACTNFEELVCGGWRERHDLRPDQGDAFTGTIMAETSATLLRHILEAPYPKHSKHSTFSPARLLQSTSSTDEDNFNKLKTAYDACMDEETIKKEGTKPLKEMLTEISDMFTKSDTEFDTLSKDSSTLSETVLFLQKLGVSALVSTGAGADDTDPDTVVVQVSSPWRIGLPAKDYYKDKDVVAKYEAAFMAVLGALYPDSEVGKAEGLLEFEKRLAAASPDAEDQNDVTKYYNPLSLRDANKLAPSLHLSKIINGLAPKDFKTKRVIVMAPRYLKDLEKILEKTSRTTVQTYFLWKTIQAFASVTEADALKPYKRFLNTLSGRDADSVPERWRTCVNHVDSGLPWILSRFFVEKAFSEEAKRFGDEIVSDIKEQFIGKIGRTEWMEDGVKEKAIEKVRRIVQKIGYPTESPDIMDPGVLKDWYRAVHVGKGTFFDNYLSMTRLQVAQEWSSLGKPVDRAAWGMSVPTVNAYYNPPGNEIVFPAGIMQFPVFSSSLPSFISYGAFGSVAGHELSHAFDSTGRHYDMNGNYTDWWTPETVKGFEDRAECFVAQYGNYSVEGPDGKPLHVNGKLTLGENIADAGGVSASFAAWKSRVSRERSGCNERSGRELQHEDQSLPGLEHFTKEQLFFVSYSNWWCGKSRPEAAVQRIYTDPHAPKWARVLGTMANSREFKEAFGCGKGEEGKEPVYYHQCNLAVTPIMQSAAAKTAKATNAAVQHGEIHLYTYFRSSCSARLRIALALKGLPATYHYVNLLKGEQKQSSYASLNPSQSVPTLEVRFPEGGRSTIRIPQSIPALEYLDEAYPSSHPLLPPNLPENLQKRALIRTLCAVIASDTQPVTNLRILKRVRRLTTTSHPVDRNEVADTWGRELMLEGLRAYESICSEAGGGAAGDGTAGAAGDGEGMFSVGNEISMADVCLVPAVWGAQRLGVDLDQVPRVRRVFERLEKEDAVVRSHWRRQGDTPVELRG